MPFQVNFNFCFREKFLVGKKCRFHCSWKLVALALTLLTLILSSVIAYFGGKPCLHAEPVATALCKNNIGSSAYPSTPSYKIFISKI
jgi:hypothetical protein